MCKFFSKNRLTLVFVAGILLFALVVVLTKIKPDGRYLNDRIGSTGLCYFEFKDGDVCLVQLSGPDLGGSMVSSNKIAQYKRSEGRWELNFMDGTQGELRLSLGDVALLAPDGDLIGEYPRMLVLFGRVIRFP